MIVTTTTSPRSHERAAVVERLDAAAGGERAAVDPEQHRAAARIDRRRVHVQVEAVFARCAFRDHAGRAELACTAEAANARAARTPVHGSGASGAQKRSLPDRGFRERNAAKHHVAGTRLAFDLSVLRLGPSRHAVLLKSERAAV